MSDNVPGITYSEQPLGHGRAWLSWKIETACEDEVEVTVQDWKTDEVIVELGSERGGEPCGDPEHYASTLYLPEARALVEMLEAAIKKAEELE